MATSVKISVAPRSVKGSSQSRRLRRDGWFPGVVYGTGKQNQMVQVNEHEFRKSLTGHSSEHVLLDLDIEGKSAIKALLQEVQRNPLTGQITHADFHEISMTEKLRIEIRIELSGTPVGVTQGGGVLEHLLREVEIECLPADLMESIKVDVSALNIGDNISVADIKLDPARYTIVSDANLAVAMVAAPVAEEVKPAEAAAEAGAAATAEPEVLKEKKPAAGAPAAEAKPGSEKKPAAEKKG